MSLDICAAFVLDTEIRATAMTGVASLIAGCPGLDLKDICTNNVAGVSGDLRAVIELSASFCYFIHSVQPPDILL